MKTRSLPHAMSMAQACAAALLLLHPWSASADDTPAAAPAPTVPAPAGSTDHARVLGLQGAPNFRDIGGYATADGKHVRWNRVYRSNQLSKLTPADADKVDSLHIVSVVDLRTAEERQQAPSVWVHEPADMYQSPQQTLAPVMHTIMSEAATPAGARAGLIKFYGQMPDDYRTEYSALFHRLARGDVPILVHCTAGKDRTGVAMALLLTSLGVPRAQVLEDYAMTEKLLPPLTVSAQHAAPVGGSAQSALSQLPEESLKTLWRSNPEYVQAALDSVDREYGSVDGYLKRGLGLTAPEIRSLRSTLLQ